MILIDFTVGILSVFASGIMAHMYRVTRAQGDLLCSLLGFVAGVAVLINMIGKMTL